MRRLSNTNVLRGKYGRKLHKPYIGTEPLRLEGNMKDPRLLASARMVTKVLENWRSEEKTGFWLVSPGTRHLCTTDCNTLSCVILIYITKEQYQKL